MGIAIFVIVLAYLFLNKSTAPLPNTLNNSGGTSTPNPTATIPPFYQENNAATADTPHTTLSVDRSGSMVAKYDTGLRRWVPITADNPIPINSIAPDEYTSNANEQAIAYANNGVGKLSIPIEEPISVPPRLVNSGLLPCVTFESPASVPQSGLVYYHEQAAQIAPNPPANPTIEATVPKITLLVTTPSRYIPPTFARSTYFNREF